MKKLTIISTILVIYMLTSAYSVKDTSALPILEKIRLPRFNGVPPLEQKIYVHNEQHRCICSVKGGAIRQDPERNWKWYFPWIQ